METNESRQVLAVDDDPQFCYALERIVRRLGHDIDAVSSMSQARDAVRLNTFDLILLDVGLPDGSGLDLLPYFRDLSSVPEVIIITGDGDAKGAEMAILNGAWDYIEKTASAKDISLTITRALQYRSEREKSRGQDRVTSLSREGIIGDSPGMRKALDNVAKAAGCDANVLITGNTGTGKELFAHAIHNNSERAASKMVVVDCASLPENLAENLLFGHKKGVYTGADTSSEGLIRMADKGSLFLDEIGELPLSLQKTLLRVVQEKRFRPLGGGKEIKSDFRLIAATNRNLDEMAEQGRFRKDLLFRIRSLHLELPDLKDRGDDVRKLARYYLDYYCSRQSLDSKGVSSDFFDTLSAYAWPGNVRELAHTMEHAVIAALSEPTLYATHLPGPLRVNVVTSGLTTGKETDLSSGDDTGTITTLSQFREMVLSNHEARYLKELISRTKTIKDACEQSGLSRSRLYALLKKYGISSK